MKQLFLHTINLIKCFTPAAILTPSLLFKLGVLLKISFITSSGLKSESKLSTAASSVNSNSVTYPYYGETSYSWINFIGFHVNSVHILEYILY